MDMAKKVITAGHICVDITPVIKGETVGKLSDALTPGKLLHVGEADIHTGGSVANTGLAMKLLGANVSLMGKVGNDSFGELILNVLRQHNAEQGMIVSEDASSSYSIVLALPGIDRIFLHNPGANDDFFAWDIPEKELKDAALFHFGYPPLMASMYENSGKELVRMMRQAQQAGAATSLDMAAVDEDSPAGKADWDSILKETLPWVDFFVPSIEELCFMLDRDKLRQLKKQANGGDLTAVLDIENDVKPLANKCLDYGAKVVLIKCGAPGMYFRSAGAEAFRNISPRIGLDAKAWADKDLFERSYVPEKVLSGTGAGDTSIAAFLTAMLNGETPEMALHFAAATGAKCVAAYDALSGLEPLEELRKQISSGWEKVCEGGR